MPRTSRAESPTTPASNSKSVGAKRARACRRVARAAGTLNDQQPSTTAYIDDAYGTYTTNHVESEEGEESQPDDDDHGQSSEEEEVQDEPQGR
ncbi:hypothetical protein B9479_008318, partial [Cryptococcus floricola]